MLPWIAPDAPPAVVQTIHRWKLSNDRCRDAPMRDEADAKRQALLCSRREKIGAELKAVGWCYGEGAQVYADSSWRRCKGASPPIRPSASNDYIGYDRNLASQRQFNVIMQRTREAVEESRISAANMCVKVTVMRALSDGAQSRRGIAEAAADHCSNLYALTESFGAKFARPTALSKAYDEVKEQAATGQH